MKNSLGSGHVWRAGIPKSPCQHGRVRGILLLAGSVVHVKLPTTAIYSQDISTMNVYYTVVTTRKPCHYREWNTRNVFGQFNCYKIARGKTRISNFFELFMTHSVTICNIQFVLTLK